MEKAAAAADAKKGWETMENALDVQALRDLKMLYDEGVLTAAEFAATKAMILGTPPPAAAASNGAAHGAPAAAASNGAAHGAASPAPAALVAVASRIGREDLLSLRAVSRSGRGAVRLAVVHHPACRFFDCSPSLLSRIGLGMYPNKYFHSSACLEAFGRVFGAGCRELWVGQTTPVAFDSFMLATNRGLESLVLFGTATSFVFKIAEQCPRLGSIEFIGEYSPGPEHKFDVSWDAGTDTLDSDFFVRLSALCPNLRSIGINTEWHTSEDVLRIVKRCARIAFVVYKHDVDFNEWYLAVEKHDLVDAASILEARGGRLVFENTGDEISWDNAWPID